MTTLTKAEMKIIRAKIDEALAEVVKSNPKIAALKLGNGTFSLDGGSFKFQLDGMVVGGISKEAQRYDSILGFYKRLPKRDVKINVLGKVGVVTGMNQTGTKVMFTEVNGKNWLIPRAAVETYTPVA